MIRVHIGLMAAALLFGACNNNTNQNNSSDSAKNDSTQPVAGNKESQPPASATFDAAKLPVSGKDLGAFPFFSLPKGLEAQNKPVERKFDALFFPLNGTMTKVEGRVWKANIAAPTGKESEWSQAYFEKSYDEAIIAAGGVKIFDGKIANEEYERYKDQATYLGEDGSVGYPDENIKCYVIHRADGDDVYIQFTGNSANGKIDILQKQAFKQTITLLKADQIKLELDSKGKAVLHINFDTDKAILKPDGKEAVSEIVKVLQSDSQLKLAINGYTDNTGDAAHNLELSKQRAKTVKEEIIRAGINNQRLFSEGFGANLPIADNATEEGKAQNRRVELVKK